MPLLSHSSRVRAFHSSNIRGDESSSVAMASQSCELRATACVQLAMVACTLQQEHVHEQHRRTTADSTICGWPLLGQGAPTLQPPRT
jgi:hypothetical protein